MTTAGIARATTEADNVVALAADIGRGWRTGVPTAALSALDSTMRPIDRLGEAGFGQYGTFVRRFQGVIDRMAGKAAAVRTFADAWQRAAVELDEATANFTRTLKTDTDEWAGEAAGTWRTRATEYIQAMRGTAGAARATAAIATAMGETVAGARTEAARITDTLVDSIISLARGASAVTGNTTDLLARVADLARNLEPAITKVESDLVTTTAQLRTSPPGRLQHVWKELGVWFGALPRNMTRLTPPTDRERGDLGRGGAYLDGSYLNLVPRNPHVPKVRIPNNVGAKGFEVGPRWDVFSREHTYHVPTSTDIPFDQANKLVGEVIAQDPVPGDGDTTGRPEGVTNNAGLGNLVRTYTSPSPDPSRYTDITVNYTLGDKHILAEGYVIRYGERMPDGTTRIVSYGEGNGLVQHPANLPAHGLFGLGWKENQADIVETVKHRMNMPPR